ncbi:MAG: hypothetical protein R3F56_20295 [Planctomycetota bacterium]
MQPPHIHPTFSRCGSLLALLLAPAALAQGGAVVFSDDQLQAADWTVVRSITGAGGTISVVDHGTGGNPGAYREVVHVHNGSTTSNPSQLWGFHFRNGAVYDPAAHGRLGQVDFRIDSRLFAVIGLDGFAIGPAILQNGRVYAARTAITPEPSWTVKSATGLTESSFRYWDSSVGNWGTGSPDFSPIGAPMQVGFFAATTHTTAGSQLRNVGLDNWRLVLTPSQGTFTTIEVGCGQNGVPRIAPAPGMVPRTNQLFRVEISGIPPSLPTSNVLMMAGFLRYQPPVDLSFLGMTRCLLATRPDYQGPCGGSASGAFWQAIMTAPPGATFYLQAAVLDPAANPAGLALSNTAEVIIGP